MRYTFQSRLLMVICALERHGDQSPDVQRLLPPTAEVREVTVDGDLMANAMCADAPLKSAAR